MNPCDLMRQSLAMAEAAGAAEKLLYRPRVGRPRTILAIVERLTPEESGHGAAPVLHVTAVNAAADGLFSGDPARSGVDVGGDQIEIALRFGGIPEKRRIARIVPDETDASACCVEVR